MANLFSPFSDDSGSGGEELDAARDLIARVSRDDQDEFIPLLLKVMKKHPNIAAAFVWLHVHERHHADDNDAMVMLAALLDDPMFSSTQRKRSAKAASEELEKSLQNRNISDDLKLSILPLRAMAGQPVDDNVVSGFFHDYDGALQRHSLEFAKGLSDSPDSLIKMLLTQGIISDEDGAACGPVSREAATELLTLGHKVSQVNPAGATLMTAALIFRVGAPDFSHEHSPAQLDDIHALATPRARWCLETLANWPGFAMPFRDKAARLAADLADRGIKCQAPLVPGEFSHGLVSMIDGMGSRTTALFHRTPQGGLDAFNVMLNDEVGVKDSFAFFENGSEMEDMFRFNPQQMSMANAPLPLLRELLADTFALHEELGTAPPGNLFPLMAYYGDDPVKPGKREPNLGAYMLETVRLTPELVAGGVEIADSPLFGCLFPASDAAYAFCEKHWDKRKKSLCDADFSAFLREIMPLERERLLHRMAVNLEVEALAGRAGRKENQTAARLWLGMRENVAPLWIIPFVRELADSAVDAIVEDLRHGFKNQREAFAAEDMAGVEPETMFADMLQRLFGGDIDLSELPPPVLLQASPLRSTKPRGKPKAKKKPAKGGWVSVGTAGEKAKASGQKKAVAKPNRNIYRLAVEIVDYPPTVDSFMQANPEIVREIDIAGDQTLEKLHLAIFKAFERDDMHAYEFQLSEERFDPVARRYVHPQLMDDDSDDELVHNATTTTLDEVGLKPGQTFLYWFDFDDDWWHGITVKGIGPPEPCRRYPRIAARHGASPPQYPEE